MPLKKSDLKISGNIIRKLAESNNNISFYELILERIEEGIWVTDADDVIFYANSAMENIAGSSVEQIKGKNVLHDFPEETIQEFKTFYMQAKKSKTPTWYEAVVVTPQKKKAYQNGWLIPLIESDNFFGMICTIRDVTKQVNAEQDKNILQQMYLRAEKIGHVGSWEYNIETDQYWVSKESKRIFGFDPAEDHDFTAEAIESRIVNREVIHQNFVDLIEKNKPHDYIFPIIPVGATEERIIHSVAEIQRDNNGKPQRVSGFVQDITEEANAKRALKESEERFRLLIENADIGVGYYDPDGNILFFNTKAASFMGTKKANTYIGLNLKDLYPENYQIYMDRIEQAKKIDKSLEYEDNVVLNNQFYWFRSNYNRINDQNGNLLGIQVISTDITKLKNYSNLLKDKTDEMDLLFENMPTGFAYHQIITDEQGIPIDYIFLDLNPAFEKCTGIKKELVLGKTVREVFPGTEKDSANWIGKYGEIALTGKSEKFEDFSVGIGKWFSITAYSPKIGYFVTLFTDITKRKNYEKELDEHRDNLETIVKERTKELESSNKELQRFNNLFVGREFRIKELKNKIIELEKRLKLESD